MSKKNLELATKIIALAEVDKNGEAWIFDLNHVIGGRYSGIKLAYDEVKQDDGSTFKTQRHVKISKKEAAEIAAKDLAKDLDDGVIVLTDTWVEDNLEG